MAIYELGDKRLKTETEAFWVAPTAVAIGLVELRNNASLWWGAVLRGDNEPVIVGENSNIQDNCVLHTEMGAPCIVGKNVTVGHMVMLHGCEIGDNSLIGIGSVILDHAKIGRNCLIGANSFIPPGKEIPDNSVVFGSPGRVVREVTPEEAAGFTASAENYVANWQRFRQGLKPDPRFSA